MFIPPISAPKTHTVMSGQDMTVLLADDKAISAIIDRLLDRANFTEKDLALRLGVKVQTLHQYRMNRRKRPSIQWLVKLVNACGGKMVIEFPSKPLLEE